MEFKETTAQSDNADMHEALVPVLTALPGPAVAATSLVVTVRQGLQQMKADSPWIAPFNRSSSHASGA